MVADETLTTHRAVMRRCVAWHADRGEPPIDRGWFAAWKAYLLQTHLAPTSVNSHLTRVRSVSLYAFDLGLVGQEVVVSAWSGFALGDLHRGAD